MNTRTLLFLSLTLASPSIGSVGEEVIACSLDCPPRRSVVVTEYGTENLPAPLNVDFESMRLELLINDMNTPVIEATSSLTFRPTGEDLTDLGLDAHLLEIGSVNAPGYETSFTHDGAALCVSFSPPVPVGASVTLETTYRVVNPPYGLHWTTESAAFPGRAAQIHTQGEPETNSYWFPCHDFPNDRMTTDLIVTSPQGYQVLSNGRLAGKDRRVVRSTTASGENDLQWYDVWHWSQDEQAGGEHPAYLVTLVVGQFDVVDVGTKKLPMPVYVPKGRGKDVEATYGRTGEMVELFERLFDEPYPWSKYAQAVVWNFGAGGMENTSATSMFDSALYTEAEAIDQDYDGLIAHELGHQWFGDLVTCDSWEHIWLNEGFATYLATLWFGQRDGHDGYLASIQDSFDNLIANDTGTAPGTPAMVSSVYEHPWEVFRRGSNPYPKGSSTLHMLREMLGDQVFFGAIADYLDEHRLTMVETDELQAAFEARSGESLSWFFDQWTGRPGIPRVNIETRWSDGVLSILAEQVQTIDAMNPAFVFDLPVWIHYPAEANLVPTRATVRMESATTRVQLPLEARPDMVVFNAELSVLAELNIDQATVLWIEQLANGPSVAAKIQAARALANEDGKAGARLLYATALDVSAHDKLRVEAVKALEAQGDLSRVFFLVPAGRAEQMTSPVVRVEVLEALGRMGYDHPQGSDGKSRQQIMATLVDHAMNDVSTRARAAAIKALGTMKAVDAAPIVTRMASVESPRDAIRQEAIGALAEFNTPDALSTVLRYCRFGAHNRTRPGAIRAAKKLMHHDQEAVESMLAEVINDPERRASETAADVIAEIGGPWGVRLLEERMSSLRDPLDRERMEERRVKAAGD